MPNSKTFQTVSRTTTEDKKSIKNDNLFKQETFRLKYIPKGPEQAGLKHPTK